ncbi:MAG: type II toxin-antitoxin system HicB family antitoxin [Deltaproteobacteria bacterium]|jgi:predicted RNase H-like HicB family nuclease|nr:type II toxin-antitoxin system HicB family antitoxin [Deltaproteobacteria bacterium]
MAKKGLEKSFVVIDGDLRLLFEYEAGWYTVSSLDIRGLNTQGKTFEEAFENAHDAAKLLAEVRAEMIDEVRTASRKAQKRPTGAIAGGKAQSAFWPQSGGQGLTGNQRLATARLGPARAVSRR